MTEKQMIQYIEDEFSLPRCSIPKAFIVKHKDLFDKHGLWAELSEHQKMSADLIREFKDKVNWTMISANQILSEDFIKEFQDKVNWSAISMSQTLSESFIREFKDKVDWYNISGYQRLSEEFILEFEDRISFIWLVNRNIYYYELSDDFQNRYKEYRLGRYHRD